MAGKPYTMREMKTIVEYLTERKVYGELKGRKMWQEFADSQKTNRTWQSLKETFIKRILPDIHNPYFKLTLDQIRSFQQGCDVAEKEKNNRLELQPAYNDCVSKDPKENGNKEPATNDSQQPTTSKEKDLSSVINLCEEELEKVTGEGTTAAAKIELRNRSSADTVVLENCYENAEQLQRALESPQSDKDRKKKPLKDLLTFEPMTPLVKELLDDFVTESEGSDKEPELKIDDSYPNNETHEDIPMDILNSQTDSQNRDEIQESELAQVNSGSKNAKETTNGETSPKVNNAGKNNIPNKCLSIKKPQNTIEQIDVLKSVNSKTTNNQHQKNKDSIMDTPNSDNLVNANTNIADNTTVSAIMNKNDVEKNRISEGSMQISGNTTSDTILPNNQEGLNDNKKVDQNTILVKHTRKRGGNVSSVEVDTLKKQKLSKESKPNATEKTESNDPVIEIDSHSPIIEKIPQIVISSETPDGNQVIDLNSDSSKNNAEAQFDALKSMTNIDSMNIDKNVSPNKSVNILDKNPCLQSVSLFEEQFKTSQYSDSNEEGDTSVPKENPQKTESPQKTDKAQISSVDSGKAKNLHKETNEKGPEHMKKMSPDKEITSDSSGDFETGKQTKHRDSKIQREKVLANIFGFANGGASTSRKRRHSHKRLYHRRQMSRHDSDSSEWTSQSENEEYIYPPRGRKSRLMRKYLKPNSSRILQDPEEGMLYVIFGKNIYPLVKDGKHIKSFVTYKPDSCSEQEEEHFWKHKYMAEKKKLEDFIKLVKKDKKDPPSADKQSATVVTPSTAKKDASSPQKPEANNGKEEAGPKEVEQKRRAKDEKLVLKFATGNGERLRLEGGWTQLSTAIPPLLQMIRNPMQSNGAKASKLQPDAQRPSNVESLSSGISTPIIMTALVDPDVKEKVNKIETEIFKEIEELEKAQPTKDEPAPTNVTKRRGRPRKVSSTSSITPLTKKLRTSKTDTSKLESETKDIPKGTVNRRVSKIEERAETADATLNKKTSEIATTSKQFFNEMKESTSPSKEDKVIEPEKRQSARLSKQRDVSVVGDKDKSPMEVPLPLRQIRTPRKYETDSSASDARPRSRRSTTKERKTAQLEIDFDDENVRFMFPPSKTNKNHPTPPKKKSLQYKNYEQDNLNSIDSTQGYQDSDPTPFKIIVNRKRKVSLTTHRKQIQTRRMIRRKSYPSLLTDLMTSDSNNSSYFIPLRKSHSTLDSEIHKTDSYRMLVPKQKKTFEKLECIKENSTPRIRHFSSVSQNNSDKSNNELNVMTEIGSSSGVSLPLSPELSIVEKLSVSRELVKSSNIQTVAALQSLGGTTKMDFSEYMISELDLSKPLMNQQCQPKKSRRLKAPKKASKSKQDSDTFVNKERTVSMEDVSLTLDQRLRNLLLESSKKMNQGEKENLMEVDPPMTVTKKNGKSKKRCSTPRSKKISQKAKALKGTVIEEEHVENCLLSGRKSCPPIVTLLSVEENAINSADVVLNNNNNVTRRKKDVIKVKIQRPKSKSPSLPENKVSLGNTSKGTTCTDSGINDAEMSDNMLKGADDSVDLIHNHSETCLLANECLGNSVEFIDNSKSVSIITLNSTVPPSPSLDLQELLKDTPHLSAELFDNFLEEPNTGPKSSVTNFTSPETEYLSAAATNSSLLTEDLSDEPQHTVSKWHLLSEDDTTNTQPANAGVMSFGSNLKHLFPLACAVPNLSTVSEMSRENDDSAKCDTQSN